MPSLSDAPSFMLAELVELRTRRGFPMYVGRANGLSVRLVHHTERTNARGETRQIWRLLAQPVEGEAQAETDRGVTYRATFWPTLGER